MYKNIKEFIEQLEKENELIRVKAPVSAYLEVAEITDRFCKQHDGGKALLFEKTEEGFPLLTNMFGSDKRIAMALGVEDVSSFTHRIDSLFKQALSPKVSIFDKLKLLPLVKEASRWMPRRLSRKGECQAVVYKGEEANLSRLPILFSAPHDGGRFITLPLVHTQDLNTGSRNVGMYRMQVFDDNTTGMHWHRHKTGERHYEEYKAKGIKHMPVTVCLGGDPAYTYSATAPLPDNLDEYLLAGFIRNRPVELVKSITNDIYVPNDCDFVIEGYVDTTEDKVLEGDFGDHTGFYSLKDYYPKFHVTCITHRKDAIYPATIVGIPPMEDVYIAKATEKIFLSPIKAIIQPDVLDMWLPEEGVAHNIAIFDINKRYIGQGLKVANAMWGAGQMMLNKFIIVTAGLCGEMTDLDKLSRVVSNISIPDDVIYSKGPLDVLDHTASITGFGGKLALDATVKVDGEVTSIIEDIEVGDIQNEYRVLDRWSAMVVKVCRDSNFKEVSIPVRGAKFVILFDECIDLDDISMLIWILGSNCDAVRDTKIEGSTLYFDARAKYDKLNGFSREWPNVVTQKDEIIELVNSRWEEYGLGEFIESPSLKYKRLIIKGDAKVE